MSVTRPRQITQVDEERPLQGGDPILPDRLDDGRTGGEQRTLPDGNAQAMGSLQSFERGF